MKGNFEKFWKINKNNMLIFLFSILFSFIITYRITLFLFLPDNDIQAQFYKYAFPVIFIIWAFLSYSLYFVYSFIVINLFKKETAVKFLYGPLISSVIGVVITFSLFIKSVSIKNSLTDNLVHTTGYYRQVAWDMNLNYLPKLFVFLLLLNIFVDLIVVLSKTESDKLKWFVSILIGNLLLFFFIHIIGWMVFIIQFVGGIFYGGINPA